MKRLSSISAFCSVLVFCATLSAEVQPSPLFNNHMVLQRSMSVPVWGTASPGETVSVTLNGQSRTTRAASDGKWMVHLRKLKAGGPYELRIDGTNSITIHDVFVGEVWLASGQSNMVFTVSKRINPWAGMP
jgi:sialate O-acetylesterase